jgi:hypothetical protein
LSFLCIQTQPLIHFSGYFGQLKKVMFAHQV